MTRPLMLGGVVFNEPVFAANSLNVVFPRAPQIRRLSNAFEDRLASRYGQPQSIPVPDNLDPQVPRIVFQSTGGHSQIVISQVSISLNVNYDSEWTTDSAKRLVYLRERVSLVYELCGTAETNPVFSGLTTRVRLSSESPDEEILSRLVQVLGIANAGANLSEVSVRLSSVVDDKFFDNITVQSYREWPPGDDATVSRLPIGEAKSRGIELVQDFNDRYAFNEGSDYHTSASVGSEIVEFARGSLDSWVARVREG